MSTASFVYTKLGLTELEKWTSLKRQFADVKSAMDANARAFGEVLAALGREITEIEEKAGVPQSMRSS